MKTNHTPTPWEIKHEPDGIFNNTWTRIYYFNDITKRLHFIAKTTKQDGRISVCEKGEAEANARRIVKCVNSYDELVNALGLAEATIKRLAKTDSANGTLDVIKQALKNAEAN